MKMTNREFSESQQPRVVAFDDQLWPIIVAILILASFCVGAILTLSRFDDPRPIFNGGTQLGILAVVTGLLIWAASQLDVRHYRRGLQLAALMSFILHLLMVVVLQSQHLTLLAEYRPPVELPPKPLKVLVDPEYQFQRSEPLTADHGQPIEARAPRPDAPEMARQDSRPDARQGEALPLERESYPVVDANDETPSKIALEPQREEAMPQLPEEALLVAKRAPRELQPAEPTVAPMTPEVAEQEPAPLSPVALPASRQSSAPELRRTEIDHQPALAGEVTTTIPSRSEANLPAPGVPRGPSTLAPQATAAVVPVVPILVPSDESAPPTTEAAPPSSPAPAQIAPSNRPKPNIPGRLDPPAPVASVPSGEGDLTAPASPAVAPTSTKRESSSSVAGAKASSMPRKTAAARIAQGSVAPAADAEENAAQTRDVATSQAPPSTEVSGEATGSRNRVATSLPPRASVAAEPAAPSAAPIAPLSRRVPDDRQVARIDNGLTMRRKTKGPLAIDGRTREPAAAFSRRGSQREHKKDGEPQATQQTDIAIELGLDFLARYQANDGRWSLEFVSKEAGARPERSAFRSDSAATGLALLSFLGAGYDHYGGRHSATVQKALDHLLANQKPNGDLYQPQDAQSNRSAWFYSHGIASIALCEAYGMTGDPALADPAQRAINFIVASQEPKRGAWRYVPGSGSDTSVSGWQLMALKSGELAGLNVPAGAYEKLRHWLDSAQVEGSQFVYNPLAPNTPEQGHGRRPTAAMTAVGLLMRMHTGWNRGDAQMVEGAEHLLERLPAEGTVNRPARDTYYWYYATQVMFHMRGKYWRQWSERLEPMLLGGQIQSGALAGSWDPVRPVPDRWGPQGGRIYVTTLNLLSLEVVYRHLPIYESVAK